MGMRTIQNRTYSGIILGVAIRGSIANDKIFRVRKGNGYKAGDERDHYQDQYEYFVPSSINNTQSEPYRRQWIAAVHKWKYDLTDSEKEAYNRRASKGLRMSGYNLFMREAMKGLVDMFVDRGDPAAYDYEKTDLTLDGGWHDLDLSAIVPAGAKAILIRVLITDDLANSVFCMRKNGNSNLHNQDIRFTKHANFLRHCTFIVACDANRVIEYSATNVVWTTVNLVVRGWWT